MMKTLSKVGFEGTYLNIVKAMYDKPTASIILNGKNYRFLKIRNKAWMPTFTSLIHIVLETLTTAVRQEEEIKGIQIGKEEVKLSLFADEMIL